MKFDTSYSAVKCCWASFEIRLQTIRTPIHLTTIRKTKLINKVSGIKNIVKGLVQIFCSQGVNLSLSTLIVFVHLSMLHTNFFKLCHFISKLLALIKHKRIQTLLKLADRKWNKTWLKEIKIKSKIITCRHIVTSKQSSPEQVMGRCWSYKRILSGAAAFLTISAEKRWIHKATKM